VTWFQFCICTSSFLEISNISNHHRKSLHLPLLSYDPKLQLAAQRHANYMAETQNMTHGENINGRQNVGQRAHNAHYNWNTVGENVAAGQTSAAQVMNSWMNSQGHRENILNRNFRNIGTGIARDTNGVTYWCMVLGRRHHG